MSRKIVEDVLGKRDARELWAVGYRPALPVTPQNYSLGSVLPAVLYMMRWGHRRGRGKFVSEYGKEASIASVAEHLSSDTKFFNGFDEVAERAVLGDLLLAYCLENKRHETGREKEVQRVFPTHYFSSWIDLPVSVGHLRGVPELLVAALARQPQGSALARESGSGYYTVGGGFEKNLMLSLFGRGTSIKGQQDNVRVDDFDEQTLVGIDQLLAIRLAQSLGEAPTKLRGEPPEIPNQQSVAQLASERFYEDFNVFLRAYGHHIPRQSLLPMLESCLSISLTNIFLSTLHLILQWSNTGIILVKEKQHPWPVLVDCSLSTDMTLRRFSERCMDELSRQLMRLPACMMCLRILDQRAQQETLQDPIPPAAPDPTVRINFLGKLLFDLLDESKDIKRDIRKSCKRLSDALAEEGETQAKRILDSEELHPAWRLAEALVILMGEQQQGLHFRKYLDSCLMIDQPNGIGRKRRTVIRGKWVERRSIVLTNTALDFLVHRHLRKAKKGTGPADLSLTDFIRILHDRYGFYIDEAPPGFSIPSDQLRKNRNYLERRLRDLGLLIGVNDAESMKRLRQRFEVDNDNND